MERNLDIALRKTIACNAPYGEGGLGQHLALVTDEARALGLLDRYYSTKIQIDDPAGQAVDVPHVEWLLRYSPARFSPSWKSYLSFDLFDRAVAKHLKRGSVFTGFVGQSLRSFQRARALEYKLLELEAANSHVRNVMRQHEIARRMYGMETSWLNEALARKTVQEYDMADTIIAASHYTRESLVAEGIPESKIRYRPLKVPPRYHPPDSRREDGVFRVVYVGSLTVTKGIPVLLEAFTRLTCRPAELILVGGYTSRAMRQYLEGKMRQDARISLAPGDPLPHLHRANVCVHPTFEDGFAYAPMEALACGVPVIVTEDTGMKDHVREGVDGYIVPTGSWEAILERLKYLQDGHLSPSLAGKTGSGEGRTLSEAAVRQEGSPM